MNGRRRFILFLLSLSLPVWAGEKITVAAAADLKFALEEIAATFRAAYPADRIEIIYGSSGKFHTQIQQGAPYDLFFSADIDYPRLLAREGLAASPVRTYAYGRLVLWSASRDASQMSLADLADPAIRKLAIANPKHAPYGKRAEEALRAAGVWEKVQDRLVLGENIAQTAQFVQSGNAEVGLIALSLAKSPPLAKLGGHRLIEAKLHAPLEQGFIITRRAAKNPLAQRFADYVTSPAGRRILARYGFALPEETARR
ncbi:MAG: molybdate ABC transporter substrate-binding protein [Rhodocyclaceae bacterium]|nr:molybdate ABC transporter substrate-binding protein [Rhodocyclaceae bacterium]